MKSKRYIDFHDNVVEVLKVSFTPREIRMRLRELEFDEKEAEKVFPLYFIKIFSFIGFSLEVLH